MNPLNILVFPCGSEIALEIHRSLKYSRFVKLYGANSVSDHGRFVYENYIEGIPFVSDNNFIDSIKNIVDELNIDAIFPAMDSVISKLKEQEDYLGCKVIASPYETSNICLSKTKTYKTLENKIPIPHIYENIQDIKQYPVFVKPDVGYGSRGAKRIDNKESMIAHFSEKQNSIVMDYLPGDEYTIDCFTNKNGELIFAGARLRQRITNGISVNTIPVSDSEFKEYAQIINKTITLRGAWFFQLKKDINGKLVLLEVASRFGGSSALYRNKGINFAMLSLFDAFGYDVSIVENDYYIELDRALDNKYKVDINYNEVYVDFDDCLIINQKVNTSLIEFIFKCLNNNKKVILITKHSKDINESLDKYRLHGLFDEIIHLNNGDNKYKHIKTKSAIFIDDSFAERKEVHDNIKIPVFSPDMIEALM